MGIRGIVIQNPREVAAAQAAELRAAAQEAAREAREAAQEAAREAREEARAAREEARAEAEAERDDGGNGTGVVTITKDGVTTVLTDATPEAIATALGLPNPNGGSDPNTWLAVPIMGIFSTAAVVMTWMVLRYRMRMRGATPAAALPADLTQRLTRMEAGIESMAVEVERISEGQRFTTRLLAERPQGEEVRRG